MTKAIADNERSASPTRSKASGKCIEINMAACLDRNSVPLKSTALDNAPESERGAAGHISSTLSSDGARLDIVVVGPLRAQRISKFYDSYRHVSVPGLSYRIDLSRCTAIDSAAVGTFLLMRDHALKYGTTEIVLEGACGQVARVLETLCLQFLFTITSKKALCDEDGAVR